MSVRITITIMQYNQPQFEVETITLFFLRCNDWSILKVMQKYHKYCFSSSREFIFMFLNMGLSVCVILEGDHTPECFSESLHTWEYFYYDHMLFLWKGSTKLIKIYKTSKYRSIYKSMMHNFFIVSTSINNSSKIKAINNRQLEKFLLDPITHKF
jgi:hypothetical protein